MLKYIKNAYYILKPVIPRPTQISLRRLIIKYQRKKYNDIWPINPDSRNNYFTSWNGWPNGKKFGLILTHDVEKQNGHDKCQKLMNLERDFGFRSSFNFVPERYKVSNRLLEKLKNNGFEIGVHGLNHDGRLFNSYQIFCRRAEKINSYLKKWGAVGFRSPAMHHNLEWISKLNIKYDLSTFDTDPFEPQPTGVNTIFPFIVENKNGRYVELPYTVPQDFTLFVIMMEKSIDIWKKKIDWISKNKGMVLINTHPDYINFNSTKSKKFEYSSELYINFLEYIKNEYKGSYWHGLPCELAEYINNNKLSTKYAE